MLHYEAVRPRLLELLRYCMADSEMSQFVLVGGTSLALHIGHRLSVDLDFFGNVDLDMVDLNHKLSEFGNTTQLKKSPNISIYSVDSIKVDFVNYRYPWLEEIKTIDHIRLASPIDIAAMKLNAIAGRGSKKNFIDIFFLLENYTLEEMIGFYNEKYSDGSEFMVIKSLTYFDDADKDEMPIMLQHVLWEDVKNVLLENITPLI